MLILLLVNMLFVYSLSARTSTRNGWQTRAALRTTDSSVRDSWPHSFAIVTVNWSQPSGKTPWLRWHKNCRRARWGLFHVSYRHDWDKFGTIKLGTQLVSIIISILLFFIAFFITEIYIGHVQEKVEKLFYDKIW